MLIARSSLILSCHLSYSSITSSQFFRLHVSSELKYVSPCRLVHVIETIIECCLQLHFYFSSSAPCLVHLIWMACEMGGKWLYSCCLVVPISPFLKVVCKVHPYNSTDSIHTIVLTQLQLLYFIKEIKFPYD